MLQLLHCSLDIFSSKAAIARDAVQRQGGGSKVPGTHAPPERSSRLPRGVRPQSLSRPALSSASGRCSVLGGCRAAEHARTGQQAPAAVPGLLHARSAELDPPAGAQSLRELPSAGLGLVQPAQQPAAPDGAQVRADQSSSLALHHKGSASLCGGHRLTLEIPPSAAAAEAAPAAPLLQAGRSGSHSG